MVHQFIKQTIAFNAYNGVCLYGLMV